MNEVEWKYHFFDGNKVLQERDKTQCMLIFACMMMMMMSMVLCMVMIEQMEMSPAILVQHGGRGKCRITTSLYLRSLWYEFP